MKKGIVILVLALGFTNLLQAKTTCGDLFTKISYQIPKDVDYIPGDKVRYLVPGDPETHVLTFERISVDEGEMFLHFLDRKTGQEVKVSDINRIKKVYSDEKIVEFIFKVIQFPIELLQEAHIYSKLVFKFFRTLAQNENAVTVVGHLSASQETGQAIANNIQRFDSSMTQMGFARPEKTTVVVSGSVSAPLTGPFSLSIPTYNIWTRKSEPIIVMSKLGWSSEIIKSKSVLYHERTHSILNATYSSKSWINRNPAIQEALADFGAGHISNSPVIGEVNSGDFIRDIQKRNTRSSKIKTLLDAENESYHNNSMIASHILWRLRQIIGPKKIDMIFKSIVDNLNLYRDSYDEILRSEGHVAKDKKQDFIYDIEYLMSVILKTEDTFGPYPIRKEISDLCETFSFSIERIESIASRLTRSNEDFSFKPGETFKESIWVHTYAAAGIIGRAFLLYWIFSP
ncbi:MAG: hypothetical protein A4S09_03500 [Proteobacteria bacterium SG_bin7]|nr:MAG: hypothetical protein A4S09_03500 [Proteobacteria bacterium SG_bin7]